MKPEGKITNVVLFYFTPSFSLRAGVSPRHFMELLSSQWQPQLLQTAASHWWQGLCRGLVTHLVIVFWDGCTCLGCALWRLSSYKREVFLGVATEKDSCRAGFGVFWFLTSAWPLQTIGSGLSEALLKKSNASVLACQIRQRRRFIFGCFNLLGLYSDC